MINVTVYGDKLDLADELMDEFHAHANAVVGEAADLALAEVWRQLQLRRGSERTVAPPEQPPEYDTGQLLASFRRITPRIRGAVAISGVYSTDPSAARLEFGRTDTRGIRTFPHPFLRPAFEAIEDRVTALIEATL